MNKYTTEVIAEVKRVLQGAIFIPDQRNLEASSGVYAVIHNGIGHISAEISEVRAMLLHTISGEGS